jgi:hypothetical protein
LRGLGQLADHLPVVAVDTREQLPLPITRLKTVVSGMRAYSFRRLLIVGNREDIENGKYRSNVSVAAVLASLSPWEVRFGFLLCIRQIQSLV